MKNYPDKFQMSPEQSLFLAKKKWDENVYCGMRMESRNITFPQTKTILQGVNVPNVQLDDIQAVLNMRDAWRFLLSSMSEPVTFEYWCKLNEFIARNEALEWGKLRTGSVGISGTDYLPPIPTAGRNLDRRHLRHGEVLRGLCMGRKRSILLGRQQAHQYDPCKQDPDCGRCRFPHDHRSPHGALQHSAAGLLQHRRERGSERFPLRERNSRHCINEYSGAVRCGQLPDIYILVAGAFG